MFELYLSGMSCSLWIWIYADLAAPENFPNIIIFRRKNFSFRNAFLCYGNPVHTVSYGILISSKEGQYRDPINRKRTRYFFFQPVVLLVVGNPPKKKVFLLSHHTIHGDLEIASKKTPFWLFLAEKIIFFLKKSRNVAKRVLRPLEQLREHLVPPALQSGLQVFFLKVVLQQRKKALFWGGGGE